MSAWPRRPIITEGETMGLLSLAHWWELGQAVRRRLALSMPDIVQEPGDQEQADDKAKKPASDDE